MTVLRLTLVAAHFHCPLCHQTMKGTTGLVNCDTPKCAMYNIPLYLPDTWEAKVAENFLNKKVLSARNELSEIEKHIEQKRRKLHHIEDLICQQVAQVKEEKEQIYPPFPIPYYSISNLNDPHTPFILPECSAIYGIHNHATGEWNNEDGRENIRRIHYIGKTTNLRNRLTLSHHAIDGEKDSFSFLPFNPDVLPFAESYYIGLLKPPRNIKVPPGISINARKRN